MEQMRVLLLGAKLSGKSSVINTVFGKDLISTNERTIHCTTLQGNVHGRELMLVDTPGWWIGFPLSDTPTFVKQELLHGVSLCSPGPHVILLVMDLGLPFKEKQRKSIEDHLGFLGDQIWAHVLVLFTRHCSAGTKTVEEYVRTEGEALQWVMEKCGHRCYFFDNTIPNISQIFSLLDKIEDIIQTNNKAYFTIDPKILQKSEDWRKNVMSRARDREIRIQQQQNYNKDDLRMMLVGWVMSGKSASGNTILNKDEFSPGKNTVKCQIGHGEVSGRPVTVIDTPSWWKFFPSQCTPESIKSEILDGVFQKNSSPHSILLVIPADTAFKKEQRKVTEENMKILGEQVWKHTIILFTSGDMLGDMTIEQHIESEGEDLQVLVEKCGNRYHVFDNEKRQNHVQVTELLQKIDEMVSRNFSLVHLSAETRERESEADAESICEERNLNEVVSVIYEEWRRRDEEFQINRVYRTVNKSDPDTEMEETKESNDPHRELQSNRHPELQGEKKPIFKLSDHFTDMFDREWSRREETLLIEHQELLRNSKFEQMRVLLLGGKFSGKSSVINTVFGKDLISTNERTIHCTTLQGNVHGRELMLVDTPGWWKDYPLSDTPTCIKQELLHGVSLCSPGPHVILLVIELGLPFKEKQRISIEDHLGFLGSQIWAHVLVLFTRNHSSGTKTVEEYVKIGGEALQWVIEKCGHTCHFFDNTIPNDSSQICSLLDKIEDIIQTNNKAYFTIDPKILQESEDWRKNVMSRARDREIRIQPHQQQIYNKDELRMMLVGWVMSGKSASGNTILNKDEFSPGKTTVKCQMGHGEVSGRPVTVIDTPSWWKFFPSQYTPERIKSEILHGAFQKHSSPHAILLVFPVDTSFKEEQRNVIEENMKILGEQVWKHTIILFTWGDMLGDMTIEQHIESEGEDLQVLVEKCGNRYHVFDNKKRESRAQVTELVQKINEMVSRNFTLVHLSAKPRERESEADVQSICEERNLNEVVSVIYEEWRRRDEEFLKTVQIIKDIWTSADMRADRSMENIISFNKSDPDTETDETNSTKESHRELQSNRHPDLQGEKKHTLKLRDQFNDRLVREWSRREEILLIDLQELLMNETSSEPSHDEIECSSQKVWNWLNLIGKNVSDLSSYASASDNGDLLDVSCSSVFPDQGNCSTDE